VEVLAAKCAELRVFGAPAGGQPPTLCCMKLFQSLRTRSRRANDRPVRCGFSIIEVLVALVLTAVGLLGMAGSAALALRTASAAARQQSAVQLATTRLAQLTATGCALARDGATLENGPVREDWTIGPLAGGMRVISSRVQWRATAGARILSLRSAMPC
jgi:prepilin-type N-terminal cleavage/methylation domain-containing protein